jgi:hypothetical protein
MKYFSYQLIASANDWVKQSEKQRKQSEEQFWKVVGQYNDDLENIKHRVSKPAWNFFRYGFGDYGLHDGRLVSFNIGDNIAYSPDNKSFKRKRGTSSKIEFLNFKEEFYYQFVFRNVKSAKLNIDVNESLFERNIGDLFTYELAEFDANNLQIGFLFASGAEINIVFSKLIFRRKRIAKN